MGGGESCPFSKALSVLLGGIGPPSDTGSHWLYSPTGESLRVGMDENEPPGGSGGDVSAVKGCRVGGGAPVLIHRTLWNRAPVSSFPGNSAVQWLDPHGVALGFKVLGDEAW